jgi:hypothetical protein
MRREEQRCRGWLLGILGVQVLMMHDEEAVSWQVEAEWARRLDSSVAPGQCVRLEEMGIHPCVPPASYCFPLPPRTVTRV